MIEHIFLAPQRGDPMREVTTVSAVAGAGLEGDRYFNLARRRTRQCQITLIQAEHIEAFTDLTGLALTPDQPRRNLVTRHIDLNALVGARFQVGPVILQGLELCEPCNLLAKRTHRETLKFFIGTGGLRAAILEGGTLAVRNSVGFIA